MSDDGAKPSQEIERTGSIDNGPNIAPAVDSQLEKKLVRKLDAVILPLTCALYLLAYLDRSNLGNARLQGLPEDVLGGDPTGAKFDWVSSMFYFSYILSQIPAVVTSKLFRPRIWIGCATIGWGLASTLQAAAFNFQGLLATRFFLGVFEAGFGPMIPLYYTFFYTKHEMGVRLSIWFGFAAVAGAFGGLIAYGVQHINSYLANWRILFLVEARYDEMAARRSKGFGNRAYESRWNEEEAGTLNKTHVIAALKDWRVYACGIIYFGVNIALASIGVFLPTIIKTFGYTNAKAQLLTVPPYAVAAVVMMGVSYMSDRTQNRGFFMASASAIGALGYLLLLVVQHNQSVRYFSIFLCCTGTYTTIGLAITWFAHNLGSESKKAAGIPLFMVIGQCGSVLGTHSYPASEGPHYIKGLALCCGFEFLGALMCLVLTISFRLENARRDRVYGPPEEGKVVDTRELADKLRNKSSVGYIAAAKDEFNAPRTTAKDEITPVELSPNNTTLQTTMGDQDKAHVANSNGSDGQDATSILRRMNATRTLQAVAQAVLAIPGITGGRLWTLWLEAWVLAMQYLRAYRDIHDDTPPSFTSTMSSIFSAFRPVAAPPPMKELFAGQPIEASVVLFPFFEYMSRNRVFRAMLAETIHPDPIKSQSRPTSPRLQTTRPPLGSPKNTGTPLGSPRLRPSSLIMAGRTASMASIVQKAHANAQLHQNVRCVPEFVSLASYILAHAGSTSSGAGREEAYAGLILDILEQCVADEGIMRAMCSPPTEGDSAVWLCRQVGLAYIIRLKQSSRYAEVALTSTQDRARTLDM
ncbi:major facilitator superfamily transporter [Rhizoctonia solani]|uniref:Major facilitator superfamily transporter n=1 Tax=Rhizoctonia solani TaxID=456999 RepID=A0A8H8P2Z3_9AGAM|nr:major facilitator superfamily transporter [Rhizoctonia solani]QRW24544.1 major facilitator superfamily transporter [Rhizoctonia solani]